jgi:hypothetical protein
MLCQRAEQALWQSFSHSFYSPLDKGKSRDTAHFHIQEMRLDVMGFNAEFVANLFALNE